MHLAGCGHGPWRNGTDFYGRQTDAIWFHIERRPRLIITGLLLAALVMHFSTQTCRIIWHSYYLSNDTLGTIPTNTTFVGSIVLAIVAGCIQGAQEKKLRAADLEASADNPAARRYPPTVEDALKDLFQRWRAGELETRRPMQALKVAKEAHQKQTTSWFVTKESDVLARTVAPPPAAVTRGRSETRSRRITMSISHGLSGMLHLLSSSVSQSSAEVGGPSEGGHEGTHDLEAMMRQTEDGPGGGRSQRSESTWQLEAGHADQVQRGRSQTMGRKNSIVSSHL